MLLRVQRVDYLKEIDNQPFGLDCTTDAPLPLKKPDSQPSEIEHPTIDIATTVQPVDLTETVIFDSVQISIFSMTQVTMRQ